VSPASTGAANAGAGSPAAAQVGLSAGGGISYNAQLSVGLSVPLLPVGLRLDGMFNQFPETGEDGDFRVLSGSVNGIVNLPLPGVTPYLIGGLGLYNSRWVEDEDVGHEHEEGSVTNMGANIGAGVRVGLPGLAVFGEVRLHNLFSEEGSTRFVPLTIGLSF
jgi:hypothetical protein